MGRANFHSQSLTPLITLSQEKMKPGNPPGFTI